MPGIIRFVHRGSRFAALLALGVTAACGGGARKPPEEPVPGDIGIGYGAADGEHLTGAVSSVTADDIRRRSILKVEDLFVHVPGVVVIHRNGSIALQIRGRRSFTDDGDPLVVIDDIVVEQAALMNAFAGLNTQDIDRVDVIKDGTAAIYGHRGANGVILVKTKRAKN
jgi:TonB-dependent SusC/RagA subfamily outer membrane receptor